MSVIAHEAAANRTTERKGLLARIYARIVASQMAKARREIALHLTPEQLEQAGWKVTERSEDSLPFVR